MARMWPKELPREVTGSPMRTAECAVYGALREQLDDSFTVFYSRPWTGVNARGEEIDGECDFVVAHAEHGLLTLEVKGGGVSYDPASDQWFSRDRWGFTHKIKDPVAQARNSKYQILDNLNRALGGRRRWIRARHAVILPDSKSPGEDLGPDRPLYVFCFEDEFDSNLAGWILKRMQSHEPGGREERALDEDGVQALVDLLARPFTLKIPLKRLVAQDEAEIASLTPQQFIICRAIADIPRAAISGPAGTGKTVLAVEEAVRLARGGRRTLFACVSPYLAEDVSARTDGEPHLEVRCLSDLLKADLMPHDALVVDEGQDLSESDWESVLGTLSRSADTRLRVFYDPNQFLHAGRRAIPPGLDHVPIRLTLNLRNTRRIHAAVQRHYKGYQTDAGGPEGQPVAWLPAENVGEQARLTGRLLRQFIEDEHFPPNDVAILAPSRFDRDRLAPQGLLNGLPVAPLGARDAQASILDTVDNAKGLEFPVVLLPASERLAVDAELCYVALSRASLLLLVIGEKTVLQQIQTNRP